MNNLKGEILMEQNENKVVFITGAASGIGYATGVSFLENGYQVVFSDRNKDGLDEVKETLDKYAERLTIIACDVTNEEEIKQAIDQVVMKHGRLDIVINNAGMQHVDLVEDFPTDTFDVMMRIMVTAPFVISKHCFPLMKKQQFGRIINMASINGLIGFAGKAAYNSAKHGIIGLTKVLALEGADHGITANALCPGYVDTPLVRGQFEDLAKTRNISVENVLEEVIYPLVPQKRLIELNELTDYMLFLAKERTKGVTGQAIVIDGGYTVQ